MSDLRNMTSWDPNVLSVRQVEGAGGGRGASFDVAVKSIGRTLVLRYLTVVYNEPGEVVVEARSPMLTSIDRITVTANGSGCGIIYDAELRLNGVFKFADPLLAITLKRIGGRAVAGLELVFNGRSSPR